MKQIRDELNPEHFTTAELKAEFEDLAGTVISSITIDRVDIEKEIAYLHGHGYIGRTRPHHYYVTTAGLEAEIPE